MHVSLQGIKQKMRALDRRHSVIRVVPDTTHVVCDTGDTKVPSDGRRQERCVGLVKPVISAEFNCGVAHFPASATLANAEPEEGTSVRFVINQIQFMSARLSFLMARNKYIYIYIYIYMLFLL